MLQLYTESTAGVVVTENADIVFTNKAVGIGCVATANTPTNTVQLNAPGVYEVSFDATISASAAAASTINVIMENNGVDMPQAQAAATSDSTTDMESISFTSLVTVRPSNCFINNTARLTFNVRGSEAMLYNANVVVKRVPLMEG